MSRWLQVVVAVVAAAAVGTFLGWLVGGGSDGGSAGPTTSVGTSSAPASSADASTSAPSSAEPTPSSSESGGEPTPQPTPSPSASSSQLVSTGAITVQADPVQAGAFEDIEVTGTVTGVPAGTTVQFVRDSNDEVVATTQVARENSYRLRVALGRSDTFVMRAVDGATVLAQSEPFELTIVDDADDS